MKQHKDVGLVMSPAPRASSGAVAEKRGSVDLEVDSTPEARTRHVVLLIESSGGYGRGLLRGIAKYNRSHGRWSVYYRPRGLSGIPPRWLSSWRGDGMLVRIKTAAIMSAATKMSVPVVNLRESEADVTFPYVTVDNNLVAKLASQHLLERGFKNFGFCGRPPGGNIALDQRALYFGQHIERAGFKCSQYLHSDPEDRVSWEQEQDNLADWVHSLPKPVGIMACNDERGLQVLDACRRCGAVVPDEVAVIGVDNDEPLCDLAIPPMTSVDTNSEAIGFEAAALLDRIMNGKKPPARPTKLAPRGVIVRHSTDVIASEDEEVNRAIRYIREKACNDLQVVDVLLYMGMSRAALQQRIKQVTGRTIHQEIQRVRLDRAKNLLAMSGLTIKQVARQSGFASVQYMTRVFHSVTGETPARYRSSRAK